MRTAFTVIFLEVIPPSYAHKTLAPWLNSNCGSDGWEWKVTSGWYDGIVLYHEEDASAFALCWTPKQLAYRIEKYE